MAGTLRDAVHSRSPRLNMRIDLTLRESKELPA
jgi:hypothetical protein